MRGRRIGRSRREEWEGTIVVDLREVTGFRGEKIAELCLTEYLPFAKPLFRPAFLGDKWPAIDLHVELEGISGKRPYFLVQTKSTALRLMSNDRSLRISSTAADVRALLGIPGPTYILGVHEPSRRVFAKSVHAGVAPRAITRIELAHELTPTNLRRLYNEVRDYWRSTTHKPSTSVFV